MRRNSILVLLGAVLGGAPAAVAQEASEGTETMRRQAVGWFKAVNVGGPFGRMVPGVSKSIDEILAEGRHLTLLMPSDMSKTGKAYYGLTWAGLFHVFELSSSQARRLGLKPGGVTTGSGAVRGDRRLAQPLAQLDRLRISHRDRLTGDQPITGTVLCQPFAVPQGALVLRFAYKVKGSTTEVTIPVRELPDDGVLHFRISPVNQKGQPAHSGPLPAFVDLCLKSGDQFNQKLTVVSNTIGTLLDLRTSRSRRVTAAPVPSNGRAAVSRAPRTRGPRLEGTLWQFAGTQTTVEFLSGGRVRYNNSTYGGKWEQQGKSLRFDSNGYTLFEVVINGDEMKGTWRRLRGSDVGMTSPTELRKIAPR
jgi:hypothetical protein